MAKTYNKSIIREIRQSFGRFAAIIAIVALGVGFLVGILSSTPDMKTTINQYYKEFSMSDYDIKSTLGFTDDDIDALSTIPEISEIMPANVMDALLITNGDRQITGRIYGTDLDSQTINKLQLRQGRMPENATECVVEKPNTHMDEISIGDRIAVSSENDDFEDLYEQTEFRVVGIVDSPYYFSDSREPSSVGTGNTSVIMYTFSEAYKSDFYTDLFILTKSDYDAFSDEYDDFIDKTTDKIEAISGTRLEERRQEIIDDAMEKVQDAKDTLAREKAKVNAELADAEKELAEGQREYDKGSAELKKAKDKVNSGRKDLAKNKEIISNGLKEIEAGKEQLAAAKAQLDASAADVESAKAALAAGMTLPEETMQQIAAYDQGLAQWEISSEELAKQEQTLLAAEAEIKSGEKELDSAEAEISKNEKTLRKASAELADGKEELAEGRSKAASEFADAEKEIADAEKEIMDIEEGEWHILDRDSNVSFARYSVDVEKVADIATLFPIFFFLIAALVSLTTMTRMVEEERIQIGTLKALGYRRITIMSKYLIYCGVATVIGCVIGLLVGYRLLPVLIFMCFGTMYDLPALLTPFHMQYAVISCALELIGTMGATWAACRHSLQEKTAQLMIPRAPKAGKRILMERIGFFWNRLSFSYKATVRNIFRYKKHLFMTIIGVAGCTALMVAGFGIQDSLTKQANFQFDVIQKYDMQIELSKEGSDDILKDFIDEKDSIKVMACSMDMEVSGNDETITSVSVYVPETPGELKKIIGLRDRKTESEVIFSSDSVIICEKMAEVMEVSIGDSITLTDPDGKSGQVTLTGITENYSGCYAYIAPEIYAGQFDDLEYNAYILNSGISGREAEEDITAQLLESEYVSSVTFTGQTQEIFAALMESLDLLVAVLVIFAGMLAAVVLYNLTNININERTRELATLRVLGYHNKEVSAYIFREIGILTIAGTLIGLILGRILLYYIVIVAESTDMMMGREVETSTYIMAAVFTLVFSAIVDLLMTFKLKKIDMAASMKAVD